MASDDTGKILTAIGNLDKRFTLVETAVIGDGVNPGLGQRVDKIEATCKSRANGKVEELKVEIQERRKIDGKVIAGLIGFILLITMYLLGIDQDSFLGKLFL